MTDVRKALSWWELMDAVGNGALAIAQKYQPTGMPAEGKIKQPQVVAGPRSPKGSSKTCKLLEVVGKPGGATMQEICEASGFDERNAKTTMSILRLRKHILISQVGERFILQEKA